MAQTLISNSLLFATIHHSRPNPGSPPVAAFAKKSSPFSAFKAGRPKSGNDSRSEDDEEVDNQLNSNPFRFNFDYKVPDVKSLIPVARNPSSGLSFGNPRRKDPGTVYVAGATGQAAVRIAISLLREGFSVRAGVPDLGRSQELARLAAEYKLISKEELKRLNVVESGFEDAESMAKSIGNASKVVVTIGSAANGPTAEVSMFDALSVVQAAQLANVGHVAIIYDENTSTTSTYNVLDGITSFFRNLFTSQQPLSTTEFLQRVTETNVSYTFIKTSLTEDFSPESSYNLVVSAEGSVGENVYKLPTFKVASLVANIFSNTIVAENKVVEVFTDPSAPSRTAVELFSAIPEDGRRKAYAEAAARAKAEEEAKTAAEKAREAEEAAKKLQEEVEKLSEKEALAASLAEEAQEKAEAAGVPVDRLLEKARKFGAGVSLESFGAQVKNAVQKSGESPKVQIATVRGQAKARNLPAKRAVVKNPSKKPTPSRGREELEAKPKEKEVRKLFGGLFQQETIYIDED